METVFNKQDAEGEHLNNRENYPLLFIGAQVYVRLLFNVAVILGRRRNSLPTDYQMSMIAFIPTAISEAWMGGLGGIGLVHNVGDLRPLTLTLKETPKSKNPISAPMVYPMIPCCNHIGSGEPVTIGCLATGYLPDPVNMTWNSGYTSTGVTTFASVYSSTRGVYMRSTQLTVPAGNWASYQCSVLHEYTGLKQEKLVTVVPCTAPSVKTFLSPICDAFSDDRATSDMNSTTMEIMCTIGGFHPGHVQVQWLANGQPATLPASTTSPMKGKDSWFSASSRLTVPKGEWNRGTLYSCSVTHPATNTSTLANISNCAEPCPCSMGVFLLPPTFEDLYLSQRAHLTCLVTNMKTTESFEFLWAREKGAELDVVTDDPKLHDNGTFTVVSRLSICAEDWLNGQKFSCTIKHPDLSSPVQVDIAKRKERSPNPPAVYLLPPSPEEVALQELVTITCLVKGFNPKDVFVRWLEKDKEVGKGYYTTTDPIAVLTGGSYFLYSSLQVKADTWEEGVPFSCVVGHEALPMHLTQKTVDKFTDFTDMRFEVDALCRTKDDYKMTTSLFMVLFLVSLFFSATITAYKVKIR